MRIWQAPGGRIWTRRDILRYAGRTGLVVGAAGTLPALVGCGDAETMLKAAADAATGRVIKPPWLQLVAPGQARLRFETDAATAHAVRLEYAGQGQEWQTTLHPAELDYQWPPFRVSEERYPDEPGLHVRHDVLFGDLLPGETYRWTVETGPGQELSGHFRAAPPPGSPFRFAFLADTMIPGRSEVTAAMTAERPELVLHGGDLQYQTNPLDTWNGFFADMAPLTAAAPFHMAIGNHEYEDMDEFDVMVARLFGAQADNGTVDWHAFDYGGIRFLMLNSEDDFEDPAGPQLQWLQAQLLDAAADAGVREVVPVFHRPYYTLSRSAPRMAARNAVHPLLRDGGVRLVLTGHNHGYERFEVEGVTYVVEAGGGAFLYDPDHLAEEIADARPGEPDLRVAVDNNYGLLVCDVSADGSLNFRRLRTDGTIGDQFSL